MQYRIFYDHDENTLGKRLADCDSAAKWLKETSDYSIKNEQAFNLESSDWGLSYEGNLRLMFTSDRVNDADDLDNRTGRGGAEAEAAASRPNAAIDRRGVKEDAASAT